MGKRFLLIILSLSFLAGCASINSLSLTTIPSERKSKVKTERSKFIVLGLNFDNDFIDGMVDDLKSQCPNGKVTGLLTKDENIVYFGYLFWKKHVTATGYCVPAKVATARSNPSPKTASKDTESFSESEM